MAVRAGRGHERERPGHSPGRRVGLGGGGGEEKGGLVRGHQERVLSPYPGAGHVGGVGSACEKSWTCTTTPHVPPVHVVRGVHESRLK